MQINVCVTPKARKESLEASGEGEFHGIREGTRGTH